MKKLGGLFIIVFLASIAFAQDLKWNEVINSEEICDCKEIITDYLASEYDDETYKNTGINVFGVGNNLGVVSGSFNQKIDLEKVFRDVVEILKDKNIDFENIRYFMFANYSSPNAFVGEGDAIVISGNDFAANLHDFDALEEKTQIQFNDFDFDSDPDIKKILKSFKLKSDNIRAYAGLTMVAAMRNGPNTTNFWIDKKKKTYAKNSKEICLKQIEKAKAKALKKQQRLDKKKQKNRQN